MKENYSFDVYTAGVDYVIKAQGGSPHTVVVEYPSQNREDDSKDEHLQA